MTLTHTTHRSLDVALQLTVGAMALALPIYTVLRIAAALPGR